MNLGAFNRARRTSEDRLRAGAVYTPPILSEWLAEVVAEYACRRDPLVLDLGAGEGSLLEPAGRSVQTDRLVGVELMPDAAAVARAALPTGARMINDDVLDPSSYGSSNGLTLAQYWVAQIGRRPSAIVMNPPWGAAIETAPARLNDRGLTLAAGQFDSYDLFCELAIQIVSPGGVCGFILPDSLLLPEHEPLRRALLKETSLLLLARLGEGFFEGVYRGTIVVVCRAEAPAPGHSVQCMRLTKSWRSEVLSGSVGLQDARKALGHEVPQARFSANPDAGFDLDVSTDDTAVFRIASRGGNWTEGLCSGRGVELSKSGQIVVCPSCDVARPLPKSLSVTCLGCGHSWVANKIEKIIQSGRRPGGDWVGFLAGEDVGRYSVEAKRWIREGLQGINYKAKPKAGADRLLVRKTGVGLNATLDTSGCYTNQVVFEYRLAPKSYRPAWYLAYVLGVLCSRVMFAFHMKRSGEAEWRSHPYVTQKTLAALPIPAPSEDRPQEWKQARAIADATQRHLSTGSHDLEIEGLVAGLYDLTRQECDWVTSVLDEAQGLAPMRALRLRDGQRIVPVIVV